MQIYGYAGCTTVKKAVNWASEKKLGASYQHFGKVDDLENSLKTWISSAGIDKVFNSKAQTFKKLDDAEKTSVTKDDASMIAAMVADPRLIKRPIGTNGATVLTGFDVTEWELKFA